MDDVVGGLIALDADGEEHGVEAGETAVGGGQDVVEDIAGAAGDDDDSLREARDGAFAGGVEEAFGFEFFTELAEGEFEGTGALGEEGFDVELEFALGFVEFDVAAGDDGEAVFGAEFEAGEAVFPEDAGELGAGFFEGEEGVAAVVGAEVGEFAGDEELRRERCGECLVDEGVDGFDGEGVIGGAAEEERIFVADFVGEGGGFDEGAFFFRWQRRRVGVEECGFLFACGSHAGGFHRIERCFGHASILAEE